MSPRDESASRPSGAPGRQAAEREFSMTRTINAPRQIVFEAWTNADLLARWFGPNGTSIPYAKVDARPGGVMHCCMRMPDGQEIWSKGIYREVVKPDRIVVTDSFADKDGNVVRPETYGMTPEWPEQALITITLKDRDGKTELTVRHSVPESLANKSGAGQGWSETLDRLNEFVEGRR